MSREQLSMSIVRINFAGGLLRRQLCSLFVSFNEAFTSNCASQRWWKLLFRFSGLIRGKVNVKTSDNNSELPCFAVRCSDLLAILLVDLITFVSSSLFASAALVSKLIYARANRPSIDVQPRQQIHPQHPQLSSQWLRQLQVCFFAFSSPAFFSSTSSPPTHPLIIDGVLMVRSIFRLQSIFNFSFSSCLAWGRAEEKSWKLNWLLCIRDKLSDPT